MEEKELEVCPDCGRVGCTCEPGTCECTEEENCGCEEIQTTFDEDNDFYNACVEDENIDILGIEETE